jgi:hypothetical protein
MEIKMNSDENLDLLLTWSVNYYLHNKTPEAIAFIIDFLNFYAKSNELNIKFNPELINMIISKIDSSNVKVFEDSEFDGEQKETSEDEMIQFILPYLKQYIIIFESAFLNFHINNQDVIVNFEFKKDLGKGSVSIHYQFLDVKNFDKMIKIINKVRNLIANDLIIEVQYT